MSTGDEFQVIARLTLALLLGALVGLEREFRGHEAGIRTSSLVCAGAAIFGEISATMPDDRIAAGVVQGVGFLGAGLIYVRKGAPAGVTTAATTWVVAGIGLLVASDLVVTGVAFTILVVGLLELAPISDWVYRRGREYRKQRGQPEPDSPYEDDPLEPEAEDDDGSNNDDKPDALPGEPYSTKIDGSG